LVLVASLLRFRAPEGNNAPNTLQRTFCLPVCVRNGGRPYQRFVRAIMCVASTQLLSHEFLISRLLVSIANEETACLSRSSFRIAPFLMSFVHGKPVGVCGMAPRKVLTGQVGFSCFM
jgi:hypothetical protein